MSNSLSTINFNKFLTLISVSFLIFIGFFNIAHAGAVINKPPVTLGLISGLVGYWSFDGPDMSGVTAYDRSGQGNNGTLTNGPQKTIGKIGQALNFDGVDDLVDVGVKLDGLGLGPMTASAWIYPRSEGETGVGTIMAKDTALSVGNWFLRFGAGTNGLIFNKYAGAGTPVNRRSSDNTITLNKWQYVTVTWTGGTASAGVHIYVNGIETSYASAAEGVTATSDAGLPFGIGNRNNTATTFDGFIDEVRVYNRALSADEIKRLYKIGATMKINMPSNTGTLKDGLVGSWSFDGADMGTTSAIDRSGNANTGWLVNGPKKVVGKIGQALNFDGVDDYVIVGDNTSLDLTTAFTISAWVYYKGSTSNSIIVTKYNTASPTNQRAYHFVIDSSGSNCTGTDTLCVFLSTNGTAGTILNAASDFGAMPKNKWIHVVAVYNGSCVYMYFNAQQSACKAFSGTLFNSNQPLHIGARVDGGNTNYSTGYEDEVRVYNRALSTDEIKRLYKIGATMKINVPSNTGTLKDGLVGSWSFDGADMGTTSAIDRSGNANTGWLVNGAKKSIGKIGQALSFDGVDDVVRAGSGATVDNIWDSGGTASVWIYPRSYGGGPNKGRILDKASTNNPDNGWILYTVDGLGESSIRFVIDFATTDGFWCIATTTQKYPTLNKWTHLAMTYTATNGTSPTFYINGSLVPISAYSGCGGSVTAGGRNTDAAQNLLIGESTATGRAFDGRIDDARVYNRALSADEIKRLYNMGR